MIPRKPLVPNNRKESSLQREFIASGVTHQPTWKSSEAPSIRTWARRGRPVNEGFGGGNRVGR
jgi:hypothetical protein